MWLNPDKPFRYEEFQDPQLAVERLGSYEALQTYETIVEPQYTEDFSVRGYPRDWQWRTF